MNQQKRVIDWSILQPGDIALTTSDALISELIRTGSEIAAGINVAKAIDAFGKDNVPSHSLFIRNPENHTGCEQTWPQAQSCNLDEYTADETGTHIVAMFRCPWLDEKHNPDSTKYLRDKLIAWMDEYVAECNTYGLENFAAFLSSRVGGVIPEDKHHTVCSMFTTLGLIKNVYCESYDLRFPTSWIVAGEENAATVGLVSPLDQFITFNSLGWGIPFYKWIPTVVV